MGKDKGGSGADKKAITDIAKQQLQTGEQQQQESSQLFSMALPGLEKSEGYYGKLASGDPAALSRANAPAIQGITQATNSAKSNIVADSPRGGERNLALDNADINKGAQVSQLTTGSYTNAFPSMASLSGQNVSQSNAAANTGLSGLSAAGSQYGNLMNINAQDKASTLGFFGSLAGAGAQVATGGWKL